MEMRSGKHQGKSLDWVRRFDARYFEWIKLNRPEMLVPHKKPGTGYGKPSPYASGYKPSSPFRDNELAPDRPQTYKSYGGYGGGYKSNEEKIRANFERWSTLESIQGRHFEDPPEGPSRYQLDNPASWGKPMGEAEEGDSED